MSADCQSKGDVVRKPADLIYGVDERPPILDAVVAALQHVLAISVNLVYPLLLARQAGEAEKSKQELRIHRQLAQESAQQIDRERHEIRQFVYTLRDPPAQAH